MKAKHKELLGALLMIAGIVVIFGTKIIDVDLTEGQSFIEHWNVYLLGVLLLFGGYRLIDSAAKDLP